MALAYNARRATRDVDGLFEPKAAVFRAFEQIESIRVRRGSSVLATILDVTEQIIGAARPLEPKVQLLSEEVFPTP